MKNALGQLPFAATTGIGSLPYREVAPALRLAFAHDVPWAPQLPVDHPAELLVPAALEGFPGLVVDPGGRCQIDGEGWRRRRDRVTFTVEEALGSGELSAFEPSATAARAFRPFLLEVAKARPKVAKVQLAGPATVRRALTLASGEPIAEDSELQQQLSRFLLARALALAAAVRRAGATPLLTLDEPGLHGSPGLPGALKALVAALQQQGVMVGLHCCGNADWAAVLRLGVDVLSIDARLSLDALLEEREAWEGFVAAGATLCLGVVPTDGASPYRLAELVDSVEASLRATCPSGSRFEELIARMLLSPACGLATRSVSDAERLDGEVREAQARLASAAKA